MIPFQKIFTILIRTFSRPMLGYIKQKQQINKGNWVGNLFIGLGRITWAFEQWTNRRILKKHTGQRTREIKDEVYLQKGVQFFYEILFYMIVLGLPFWELYKSSLAGQKKEQTLQKRIKTLDKNLQQINKQLKKTVEYLKKVPKQKVVKTLPITKTLKNQNEIESPETKDVQPSKQNEQNKVEVQELLQNALQVMADEFQDALDDLEFQVQVQSEANQGAEGDIGAGQSSQEIETMDEAGSADDSSSDLYTDIQVDGADSGTSTQ